MRHYPRAVIGFALLLALLTSLPYAVGALSAPPGGAYSGAAAVPIGASVDFNSHMAKMWQGQRGQLAYRLLFTHEDHPGLIGLQAFYVLLGSVASLLPLSLPLLYHITRFVLTVFMVLAIWRFACHYLERPHERWLALLLGTLAGGWGPLLYWLAPQQTASISPIEYWLSDAYNLMGAFYMPHFAAAISLQIVLLLAFERWRRCCRRRDLLLMTLALALDMLVQPYAALLFLPLIVALTAHSLLVTRALTWSEARGLVLPLGLAAGLVLLQALALRTHPIWQSFVAQNLTPSPPPVYYLLGYLPLLIPIMLALPGLLRDERWRLPLLWVGLVLLLIYAPVPAQRRYLMGVQTPLALLAALGWRRVWAWLPSLRWRLYLTSGYMALAAVSLLAIITANVAVLSDPDAQPQVFYSADERAAFDWIRDNTSTDALILTTFADGLGSGGPVVAATGRRVYAGHWFETADFERKMADLARFYDLQTSDAWRRDFLRDAGIGWVWLDSLDSRAGPWVPESGGAHGLRPAFVSGSVTLYRVVAEG